MATLVQVGPAILSQLNSHGFPAYSVLPPLSLRPFNLSFARCLLSFVISFIPFSALEVVSFPIAAAGSWNSFYSLCLGVKLMVLSATG